MGAEQPAAAITANGRWERLAAPLLVATGVLILGAALALDPLGLSDRAAFGVREMLLAGVGLALVLNGLALRAPGGVAHLAAWREESSTARLETVARYGAVLAQLAVLFLVLRRFEIENAVFYDTIALLAFGGFAIHAVVPRQYRMGFFLALSLAGIGSVFGLNDGLWMVGVGAALVGVCHLPLPWAGRVALLLGLGAALATGRAGHLAVPFSEAVWPILGSMFMFRLIVYVYDLRHAPQKPTVVQSLAYFFLLPNAVFPLFPVVDFSTIRRTYYDKAPLEIYQKGVRWMFRGVLQLLLYRVIYQYFTLAPSEVHTAADLAQYMVANFGLYIRVSGQFHLVTGLLHLFGFDLPVTHNRYFLAASFTDFWRRINIYWKDFMLKLVFNPVYFRLKKRGETGALVIGTVLVFAVTWTLHSYQWFWLLGSFPITGPDLMFWGILCILMIANTVYEARHGRRRTLTRRAWSLRTFAPVALKTAATFVAICVLWSLWTSTSLDAWVALVTLG